MLKMPENAENAESQPSWKFLLKMLKNHVFKGIGGVQGQILDFISFQMML